MSDYYLQLYTEISGGGVYILNYIVCIFIFAYLKYIDYICNGN